MYQVFSSLTNHVLAIFEKTGYVGVFLVSLLDRLTVFLIPAEVVLPAYGILISRGVFMFWSVFILLTLGNFMGNVALYLISFKGGRPFLEKYGRYVLVSKHELNHLDRWFLKYGYKIIFFGYLIPTAIRSLIPIPAGITRMNFGKFCFYTLLGSAPLNILYLFIGIKAGDNFHQILEYFHKLNYVIVSATIVLVIWYVYRHIAGKHLTHNHE